MFIKSYRYNNFLTKFCHDFSLSGLSNQLKYIFSPICAEKDDDDGYDIIKRYLIIVCFPFLSDH